MKKFKMVNIQVLVVCVAFITIILLGLFFIRRISHEQISNFNRDLLEYIISNFNSNIEETEKELTYISSHVRNFILHSDTPKEDISHFFQSITRFLSFYIPSESSNFSGLLGIFPSLEEPIIENINYSDFLYNYPYKSWYTSIIEAQGRVVYSVIYQGSFEHTLILYSQAIYDYNDTFLGIVSISIQMKLVEKYLNSFSSSSNYEMLFGTVEDSLVVFIHQNKDYIGKPLQFTHPKIFELISEFNPNKIIELDIEEYNGIQALTTIKSLDNGWHLGIINLKEVYHEYITKFLLIISSLGMVLTIILSSIIIHSNKRKEKAIIADQNKTAFLSTMSHEIRTPLNAIIGMANIGEFSDDPIKKEYCLKRITDSSKHLLGVINNILDLSKIEAKKFELNLVEFEFREMFHKVSIINEYKIKDKDLNFSLVIDDNIPKVLVGDDQHISQVITNLLGNAIKFTPNNGNINIDAKTIYIENDLHFIQVSIKDSGIGIPKHVQQNLFQEYQQASASTSYNFGGTGLGLKISKDIIEMMGGKIWVESEENQGSTFIFNIPLLKGNEITYENHISMKDNNDCLFEKNNILLVEDSSINQEIFITMMEKTLLKIDCAENGFQAIKLFTDNPEKYQLILMDIQMPEMDGIEATKRIRELESLNAKAIPIIAMTANVFKNDVDKYLSIGMNDHIGKPFDFDLIINKLKKYLL